MFLFLRCALRCFSRRCTIISVLTALFALSGCSAIRLGYNNAPDLGYWYLDNYVDFDSAQSVRLKTDLQALQDWHRKEALPQYAELLKTLQPLAQQSLSNDQVCALYDTIERQLVVSAERMLPTAVALTPTLQPHQLENLARTWEKHNKERREEWLEGNAEDRLKLRLKKLQDRAESFYGRQSDAQIKRLTALLEASPFDGALQYQETLRRQQDILQTVKALRVGTPETQMQAQLHAVLERSLHSPDPALRQYQDRMRLHTCSLVAALHNQATPTQRSKLLQTLQGYDADARALMASR